MRIFLFTGQGSQINTMGLDFYNNFKIAKKYWKVCNKHNTLNLKYISFDKNTILINKTRNCQLILYVHEYIIFKLSNFSVNSKVIFGGLSLGEITALSSTRIFYFISTIYIVKVRSFTMNYLCNSYAGSMSAISNYRSICEVYILVTKFKSNISNINSNKQIVISGDSLNINHLKGLLIRNNINIYDIKVHGSFHSESMINAGLIMYYFMKRFKLKSPTSKILSNLTGFFYKNKNFCFYISKQIFKPVNFLMNTLCVIHQKPLFIFELGCGKIISNLLRRNFSPPTFKVFQISTMHDYLNKNLWV